MKDKKKQQGMKAKIRAYRKRSQYIATAITVAILVAIIAFASFLIYSYLNPSSNQTPKPTTQLKAAIVDHLSLTVPNPTFNQTATTILETANYTVDYYPGEEVTVKFYENLPTHGYDLIILRVHSMASKVQRGEIVEHPVAFFTSEKYSNSKYGYQQLDDQIGRASYHGGNPPFYFAILPKFVASSMKGKFQNTTIIMMGCEGIKNTYMAEAFVQKGAKVYISWNGSVSASHTDQATTQLLEHLITEKQTIKQAVTETMKEVGPDPAHGSILLYYPTTHEVEDYVIQKTKSNLTTNVVQTNPKTENKY